MPHLLPVTYYLAAKSGARMMRRFSKDRDFLALWAATTVSQFGTMLGALSLTALLYLKASPAQMGLLAAATSLPVVLVALVAGVWVDRLPRKPVMVFADLGRFLLLMTVPAFAL